MMIDQPNILLITTDTQRCDTLKCMGNSSAVSPHIDRLAFEGILFENAHTSSPVCMPARTSLLTGVHTPIHGSIENGIRRRTDLTVFPDLLKEAGYYNIMVGKTHFAPVPNSFDVLQELIGEKRMETDDFYGRHLSAHGYSRKTQHPNPVPEELFAEAFLVDTMIEELEKARSKDNTPFFAWCSMLSPHEPFDPPGKWADVYRDRPLPPLNYQPGETAYHPRHMRDVLGILGRPEERRIFGDGTPNLDLLNEKKRLYYGLASYCDHQVGRLLDYLDHTGRRSNTLVIFTSDHGTQLGDHGFFDKHNYYDASWRIPLILSMPGTLPQRRRCGFAVWHDLAATILAAAGTYCPAFQAFDLFTPLSEGKDSPRHSAVATLYKSCAVATERWKLEYYFEEGRGRLFDRRNDPQEQIDLYETPVHESLRNKMVQALLTWRADLSDVERMQKNTYSGGPIAMITSRYTHSMQGADADHRLDEALASIDEH